MCAESRRVQLKHARLINMIVIGLAVVAWGLSGFTGSAAPRGRRAQLPTEARIAFTVAAALLAGVMYRQSTDF